MVFVGRIICLNTNDGSLQPGTVLCGQRRFWSQTSLEADPALQHFNEWTSPWDVTLPYVSTIQHLVSSPQRLPSKAPCWVSVLAFLRSSGHNQRCVVFYLTTRGQANPKVQGPSTQRLEAKADVHWETGRMPSKVCLCPC